LPHQGQRDTLAELIGGPPQEPVPGSACQRDAQQLRLADPLLTFQQNGAANADRQGRRHAVQEFKLSAASDKPLGIHIHEVAPKSL